MKRSLKLLSVLMIGLMIAPISPGYSSAEQGVGYVMDTRISFDVNDADVADVLRTLAESFDLNIVVGEDIKGTVSLKLKNVRLQDALDLILDSTGYYYTLKDNIILIQTPEKDLITEIKVLGYSNAGEIKSNVSGLLSELGSIEVGDDDSRLIIKEVPKHMKMILKEIEKYDHPPRQVLIEARMMEIEDTDLTSFGITWNTNANFAGSSDSNKNALGSRTFVPAGASSTTTSTTTEPSSDVRFTLPSASADLPKGQWIQGLTWGRVNLAATVDALIRTNRAHILASPTIATLDGEEAKIIIGEKFPFRENTLTAVGTTETTKFVDVGVALRVTPKVMNNRDIMLQVHPEVSSVNETLTAGPRISTREATTQIIVQNGQTIVIAGLIQHDKTVIRQKVPVLGNIPLIGLAFRNKSTDFVRKELAVFITPYILTPLEGEEGENVVDEFSSKRFFTRAVSLTEEFGIESLGKSRAQRLSEAIANFRTIIRNYRHSQVADDAHYYLGRLYYDELRKFDKAAETWQELINRYPDSLYNDSKLHRELKRAYKKMKKARR